jgi:hypothetical protein
MLKKAQEGLQNPKPLTKSGTYDDFSTGKSPSAKGSLNTNGGKSAGVPCLEKHSLKSGFFTKKVPKGQG